MRFPYLLFSVLLRRVWKDLEGQSFVLERDDRGKRIPVFGGPRIAELLAEPELRENLVENGPLCETLSMGATTG